MKLKINIPKDAKSNALFVLLASFFLQYYSFGSAKLFMMIGLGIFILYSLKIRIKKLYNHEVFWLSYFLCVFVSSIYAPDKKLAMNLVFGQIILIIVYFTYRYLLDEISLEAFEKKTSIIGACFVSVSLILYFIAVYKFYVSGEISIPKSTMLDASTTTFYGMLLESGRLPRLIGLAESPNNYAYFSNFLFWFFAFSKKRMLAGLTLFTYILTLSSTGLVVIFTQVIIFLFFSNRKIMFYTICFSIVLLGLAYFFYINNDEVQNIINIRAERNKSGTGRVELFEYVWGLIVKSPIIGYGANQTRILIKPFRELISSHNSFLEIFLTTGILGFTSYLLFSITVLRNSFFIIKKGGKTLCFLLSVGFFIFSLTNNTLHIGYSIFLLGFLYINNLNTHNVFN